MPKQKNIWKTKKIRYVFTNNMKLCGSTNLERPCFWPSGFVVVAVVAVVPLVDVEVVDEVEVAVDDRETAVV